MSKWSEEFAKQYKTTANVKRIKEEMKKIQDHKDMDKILSEVIKGKWKRKVKV